MNNELMFVTDNWFIGPDPARTLKAIQFCHPQNPECDWQEFEPTYDLDSFTEWREAAEKLNSMDKLVMFGEFANIEDEFEPLEEMIGYAASEIDYRIQMEIDPRISDKGRIGQGSDQDLAELARYTRFSMWKCGSDIIARANRLPTR